MKSRIAHSYCRWSHPSQTLGTSEQRQIDRAAAYAKANNLQLSDKRFLDKGISAKAGLNREKGSAFAKLLEIMNPNEVALIEDYDRFSRQDPITSLSALREILKTKSISIVFMSEGVEVNEKNFLDDHVILPLFLKGFLGFRENTKKGDRVSVAWVLKAEEVKQGKRVLVKLPSWLYSIKEPHGIFYKVNDGKAKTVKRIFELALSGKGSGEIAQRLNDEKATLLATSKEFNQVSVLNVLRNKAVIGENVLNAVKDYYPRVIDDKTFYVVQSMIDQRKVRKDGSKTTDTNIFSRLCVCAECQGTLYLHQSHGYEYLICPGAKKGGHKYGSFSHKYLEHSFLNELISSQNYIKELVNGKMPENKVGFIQGKISTTKKRIEQVTKDYEETPSKVLAGILSKAEVEILELEKELTKELAVQSAYTPFNGSFDNVIVDFVGDYFDNDEKEFKQQFREQLRNLVDHITIDLRTESYEVYFKNASKPLKVTLTRKNGKIDGYESVGEWSAFGE